MIKLEKKVKYCRFSYFIFKIFKCYIGIINMNKELQQNGNLLSQPKRIIKNISGYT